MPALLSDDFAEFSLGPLTLTNNTWGIDTWGYDHWVNGTDYRQTIRYSPGDLTRGLRFDWSYDSRGDNVLAYPELILGYKPWSQAGDRFLVGQVDTLRSLTIRTDIDIRGDTGGFNIAYDLWLTDRPAGGARSIAAEVMVWLHPGDMLGDWQPAARLQTDAFSASVYFDPEMSAGTDHSWSYAAVVIDGGRLDGEIDLALILRRLADKGFIDRGLYLSAVELGAEVVNGTGGFDLDRFGWTHSTYAVTESDDRLTGTDGADRIAARGGDDSLSGRAGDDRLIGGAGTDRLTGGAGADRFVFASAAAAAGDLVTDFTRAEGDRIDLRGLGLELSVIGAQGFHGLPGEVRLVPAQIAGPQGTRLRLDLDGDGRADATIRIAGVALDAGDLLL